MKIREVDVEKDYDQIQKLHVKYNLKILDKNEWLRFWRENPYLLSSREANTVGWVIEDNKNIFGYIGNVFKEYYYNDEKIITSCIHAWVVEEKYRWQAFLLIRKFFAQKNVGVFLNTTANSPTRKIWLKYNAKKLPLQNFQKTMYIILDLKKLIYSFLKYKNFILNIFFRNLIYYFTLIVFFKKLNFWKKVKQTKNTNLNPKIDNKFDKFWLLYKSFSKNKFLQSRTSAWINWHLNTKINNGKAWLMTVEENNEILGYAICAEKNNTKIDLKKISLVDLVALNDNQEIYTSLIKSCIIEAEKRKYYMFEIVGFKKIKRNIFSNFKMFKRRLANFPFYYKIQNKKYENFLKLDSAWDPSLLDGDSFL